MQPQEHERRLLLRTEETAKKYEEALSQPSPDNVCRLCNDPETIADYTYWRLVPNRFPYDRYFAKSDMLVSKRHVDEVCLTAEETAELIRLKSIVLNEDYDLFFENLPKQKSIPHHVHYHVAVLRKPE